MSPLIGDLPCSHLNKVVVLMFLNTCTLTKKKKKTRTTRKREQLSRLEEQCAHAAHVTLFLDEDFEVLVDDCDGKKDTRATANGTQEVGEHR